MRRVVASVAHRAFPHVAHALRAGCDQIIRTWRELSIAAMPHLDRMTIEEFENDVAAILSCVATALETEDPDGLRGVLDRGPAHGFHRFNQQCDLIDLFQEERILRGVIIVEVHRSLGRTCEPDEAAALHTMIDLMLQQGVLALVERTEQKMREQAECELKFLSFFSHDLNNNLFAISSRLQLIERRAEEVPELAEYADLLRSTEDVIRRTRHGLRRLLQHEQLRLVKPEARITRVDLRAMIDSLLRMVSSEAEEKGLRLAAVVEEGTTVETDGDLLNVVLQNLIGNAVKHTSAGTIQVRAEPRPQSGGDRGAWEIAVVDEGPGIPPEQVERIFQAFERGHSLGTPGVGLGLAIAAQAARLMGAKIEVEAKPGEGCTFRTRIPARSR